MKLTGTNKPITYTTHTFIKQMLAFTMWFPTNKPTRLCRLTETKKTTGKL